MQRSAAALTLGFLAFTLSTLPPNSADAGCRWIGEAPACGGGTSKCAANEDFIEYAGTADNSNTGNSRAPFGAPCWTGGKVLCCTKLDLNKIGTDAVETGKGAAEGAKDAGKAIECPGGQLRIKGKCEKPGVMEGTNTGSKGGGLIQMRPDCASGTTYSEGQGKCVANPPPAAETPPVAEEHASDGKKHKHKDKDKNKNKKKKKQHDDDDDNDDDDRH